MLFPIDFQPIQTVPSLELSSAAVSTLFSSRVSSPVTISGFEMQKTLPTSRRSTSSGLLQTLSPIPPSQPLSAATSLLMDSRTSRSRSFGSTTTGAVKSVNGGDITGVTVVVDSPPPSPIVGRFYNPLIAPTPPLMSVQSVTSPEIIFGEAKELNRDQLSPASSPVMVCQKGHRENVLVLACNESFLFSGCLEGVIAVWNVLTLAHEHQLRGHQSSILALSCHETFLISSSSDNTLRLWDMNAGFECLTVIRDGKRR
jgi:WD40 repeat protein